jgi:hypothetical protein
MIQYFPVVTGSLTVSGSVLVSGSIVSTGGISISGSIASATSSSFASTASSADNLLVRNTLTAQTLVVQTITSSVDFVTGSTRFGSLLANTHVFTGSMAITGGLVDIVKDGQSLRIWPQSSSGSARIQLQNSGSGGLAGANAIIAVEGVTGNEQFTSAAPFSFAIGTATQKAFHLGANSAVVMTITGSNVGIGTTNPSYLLDVNGYGRFKINALSAFGLDIFNNAGTRGAGFYNTGGNNVQLYFYNSSSTETIVLDSTSGNLELKGYMKGGAVTATSGFANETQTISTAATVYYLNKDQGASGGSSSTTFNITGIPNTDGSFALLYLRSSNTAAGFNVGMIVQIHGNTVFSTSTQNVTKTASFMVFRANGSWFTSAVGNGSTAGYP